MSFAEKIIEGMVDENGCCGDRGMSEKQFKAIVKKLDFLKELEHQGGWEGDYRAYDFCKDVFAGYIGRYHVLVDVYHHWHDRYEVIDIRPWIYELPDFTKSEFVGAEKERLSLELTLVSVSSYWREKFNVSYYSRDKYEQVFIYRLMDAEGNLYSWKTLKAVDGWQAGDKWTCKATVKEHKEFAGRKETVLTRCKINEISKVHFPTSRDILEVVYGQDIFEEVV